MGRAGLCSVTFRALEPEAVSAAAADAGLSCLEWAGDVHAPASHPDLVRRCREASAASGVQVSSLGSYWKAGVSTLEEGEQQLEVARLLGAARVRVWAGVEGSAQVDADGRAGIVGSLRALADRAADLGIGLGVEHHPDTLSDTARMTLRLLDEVDRDTVTTYWQPDVGQPGDAALEELDRLLAGAADRLSAVHVFSWWPRYERHTLRERADLWAPALERVTAAAPQADVMIEFLPEDRVDLLVPETLALKAWLSP
jgi:3-dehydroshikimate dehydratase